MTSKSSSKQDQNKKHYTGKNIEEKVYLYAHEKLFHWIGANVKTIGIVVGAILLIVIIGFSWRAYQKGITEKALALEGKAFQRHQEVQADLASKEQATASETPSDALDPYQEVIALYQDIIDQYPGTASAGRAQYLLGSIAYQRGNYDEAKTFFSDYLKTFSKGPLAMQAEESLAYVLEQQQDYQQALDTFKRLETRVSEARKPAILLAVARNYEALGQTESAIAAYQSIVDSNTSFSLKNTAKERLDLLQMAQREPRIIATALPQEPAETSPVPAESPVPDASPVPQAQEPAATSSEQPMPESTSSESQPVTSAQPVSEEPSAEIQPQEELSGETAETPTETQTQETPSAETTTP